MTIQSTRRQPRSRQAALAACAAVLAGVALVPAAAHAQQYGSAYDQRGQYYYDGCRRETNGRTAVGAILGGIAGMALGNNITNDRFVDRRGRVHDNDTGAAVGAIAGAIAGGSIGRGSAACVPEPLPQQRYSYNDGYSYTPDYSRTPRYDDYYYDRYQSEPAYAPPAYDDYGYGGRGCRMVESRIRMPDGRPQTRMVRACPDSQGRYQIVD
jgi:hypothetical protein